MVMTKDSRGIECDLCGSVHKNKFSYYSAKVDKVVVDCDMSQVSDSGSGIVEHDKRFLDIDICDACYNGIIQKMKLIIHRREQGHIDEPKKADWSLTTDGNIRSKTDKNRK